MNCVRAVSVGCVLIAVLASSACSAVTSGRGGGRAAPNRAAEAAPRPAAHTSSSLSSSASAPVTFSDVYAAQHTGVIRIETVGCTESGVGSGFLISPRLVATVAHVVDDSVVVSLVDGGVRTTGTVIGLDRSRDLALVRATRPLPGYRFHFAKALPGVGDPVAAVGFPVADPITMTQGHISGLSRKVEIDGVLRTGLVETDTAVNPGNSGGPLLAADGSVIGLVDAKRLDAEGIGWAVPGTVAAAQDEVWRSAPQPEPAATCSNPLGPSELSVDVPVPTQLPPGTADGVMQAFETYFGGINSGDYDSAYDVLSDRLQQGASVDEFAEGVSTSFDTDFAVIDAYNTGPGTARLVLSFTSLQAADHSPGHSGDTCDLWTLNYRVMRDNGGSWRIDGNDRYEGEPLYTRC